MFRALTGESGVFGTAAIDATHVKRWMQDLVIETAHASLFAALFVTHDLIEATRIAQRIIVLDVNGDGVAGERLLAGDPDSRGDREIFETVHGFLHDAPIFRHIYDVDERKLA